ncbi:MAG: invasion associated locus B family protein [Rhodobacteraceae bacterium]|nr:invasion associated locus B family protein [Paracoccaceae bacterium]
MRNLLRPLAVCALATTALGAGTALAQDATAPAEPADNAPAADAVPADTLPTGESAAPDTRPQAYVKETFKDWRVVCVKLAEDRESCNMQQLMLDDNQNPVSQVSIAPLPPAAAPRAAAVEIAAPLETLLSEDLRLGVGDATPVRYRFSFCTTQACFARFALTADEVAAFKAGSAATVKIVPLAAPDQTANISMSLSGFTAAFDMVTELQSK